MGLSPAGLSSDRLITIAKLSTISAPLTRAVSVLVVAPRAPAPFAEVRVARDVPIVNDGRSVIVKDVSLFHDLFFTRAEMRWNTRHS
jgi:hypothetical protein